MQKLYEEYLNVKEQIENRLSELKHSYESKDNRNAFSELAFCIFTPQSSAKSCWEAVLLLGDDIFNASAEEIAKKITVRFRNRKALFLVEARKYLNIKEIMDSFSDSYARRDFLLNIKGIGYKEAGHYLRNIGYGEDLAILDRHILKNLVVYKVIDNIPTLTKSKYLEIEKRMQDFSNKIKIPMQHLDFLFWYKQAGYIFK